MSGPADPARALRGGVLAVVVAGLVLPIAAGLWETLRASFGVVPVLGFTAPGLGAWRDLAAVPGLATSLRLTLVSGAGAAVLSGLIALGAAAALHHRIGLAAAGRVLTPFLAIPHAAMAIGLAFVLAPSGWIARALAAPLGWLRPPDVATVGDDHGLALMLGLVVKEVPFLLLVTLAALSQLPLRAHLVQGRSLGYRRGAVWARVIVPQLWPLIRLPVLVVLAYGLSVVDMALILGPSTPPTLAVQALRLFTDPDTARLLPASAAAMLQAGMIAVAFGLVLLAEGGTRRLGRVWLRRGHRGQAGFLAPLAAISLGAVLALGALAMTALVVWSLAWRWPWPGVVPESWSLRAWVGGGWGRALLATLTLAMASTALSLALAIAWLEAEGRARRARWAAALIYLPLLVPQIGFLYGLNILFLRLGVPAGPGAVVWAHALFVFPYVMITLSDPWRALDPRLTQAAAALGAGRWRRLVAVKLPVLLAPVLTAAAIGMAVSVAQYLPTLFMGAGRIATLTTEAVTLASSSDRRVVGVYATLQAALPFAAYLIALGVPAMLHRNRAGLRGGA